MQFVWQFGCLTHFLVLLRRLNQSFLSPFLAIKNSEYNPLVIGCSLKSLKSTHCISKWTFIFTYYNLFSSWGGAGREREMLPYPSPVLPIRLLVKYAGWIFFCWYIPSIMSILRGFTHFFWNWTQHQYQYVNFTLRNSNANVHTVGLINHPNHTIILWLY